MPTVYVDLRGLDTAWTKACRKAIADLNTEFKQNGVKVVLTTKGPQAFSINVITDPAIQGSALHGRTSNEADQGGMLRATTRLPVKVTINSPSGVRDSGIGVLSFIAAHEFVHALGHVPHNTLLMTQTLYFALGDTPAGDKLTADSVKMPPIRLSSESLDMLKGIWT